jgi:type III pantothenate kinase
MKADVLVDIGNSRMKWGFWSPETRARFGKPPPYCIEESAVLPLDDPGEWLDQKVAWQLFGPISWIVSGVNPSARDRFVDWLEGRRDRGEVGRVKVVSQACEIPIRVILSEPTQVGIDRLLNAVASNVRRQGRPAIIVDSGSAVTVDLVDETGAFCGGAIFPGVRLMAKALNDYTALLPLVEVSRAPPALGLSTVAAIESGIYYAVAGAINSHIQLLGCTTGGSPTIFLTGGDAALIQPSVDKRAILWPEMTLEGIRIAAEGLE